MNIVHDGGHQGARGVSAERSPRSRSGDQNRGGSVKVGIYMYMYF